MNKNIKKVSIAKHITKKNVILASMSSILVSVPLTVGFAQISSNTNQSLNGMYREGMVEGTNSTWSIKYKNKSYTFNDPAELRNFLAKEKVVIENKFQTSESDISKYFNPLTKELMDDEFWNKVTLNPTSENQTTTIYEGKNSSVHDTEESAKKSFQNVGRAYSYNGLYFKDQGDLSQYLNQELGKENGVPYDSIVIQAPNGIKSQPINLTSTSATEDIKNFITNNSVESLEYVNSKTNKMISITNSNYTDKDTLAQVELQDLQYIHVQSNQGQSRYVIDNNVDDEHNLIGPYFYKGNLDIGSFTNKNMWKKVNKITSKEWQQSQVDTMIGTFFSSVTGDDNLLNLEQNTNPTIFRSFLSVNNGKQTLDEVYLDEIKKYSTNLYNEIISTLKTLMTGKKFNTFYKLPIMYSFILSRLIDYGAEWSLFQKTFSYFSTIADYIQKSIESIILDPALLINSEGKKLNIKELFQIGVQEHDINTSMEYYMNEFKKFDKLIPAISAYIGAINNINTLGGLIPYDKFDQSYLVDFKIVSQKTLDDNYSAYQDIYNTYSNLTWDGFINDFVNRSKQEAIQPIKSKPKSEWSKELDQTNMLQNMTYGMFLRTIGAKNTVSYEIDRSALLAELQILEEQGEMKPDGLLFIIGKEKAQGLLEFMKKNPEHDIYQTYLAILIDIAQKTNIFNTKIDVIVNGIIGIERAVATALTSVAAVTNIINEIYWKMWMRNLVHLPSAREMRFKRAVNEAIRTITYPFRDAADRIERWLGGIFPPGYDVGLSKWKVVDIFSGVDYLLKGLDSALPILGGIFVAFELFGLIYELFKATETQDFYVYTAADGTEFYWDGGKTVSKYFGFDVKQVSGIDNMILNKPIQITKEQTEEFYYFNKIKFYRPEELKIPQLKYMLSTAYNSENQRFRKGFTFGFNNVTYSTKDALISDVMKDMGITSKPDGSIDSSKLNRNSNFISNTQFIFSDGMVTTHEGGIQYIIKNILDNIRWTMFAKIPKLDESGKPTLDQDDQFVIPGKVWKDGKIEDNSSLASQYIIDNSANEQKQKVVDLITEANFVTPNKVEAEKKSENKVKQELLNKFSVNHKNILTFDYLQNRKSKYNLYNGETIFTQSVYSITIQGKGTYSFLEREAADNFVLKEFNFKKNTQWVYALHK